MAEHPRSSEIRRSAPTRTARAGALPLSSNVTSVRENGIKHESDVEWAVLEPDGKISFFKKQKKEGKS